MSLNAAGLQSAGRSTELDSKSQISPRIPKSKVNLHLEGLVRAFLTENPDFLRQYVMDNYLIELPGFATNLGVTKTPPIPSWACSRCTAAPPIQPLSSSNITGIAQVPPVDPDQNRDEIDDQDQRYNNAFSCASPARSTASQPSGQVEEADLLPYPTPIDILSAASHSKAPTGTGNPWNLFEEDAAIERMLQVRNEGKVRGEDRFRVAADLMRKLNGVDRTWLSVKNFWNRKGRARSGWDERKCKKAPLATSKQGKDARIENALKRASKKEITAYGRGMLPQSRYMDPIFEDADEEGLHLGKKRKVSSTSDCTPSSKRTKTTKLEFDPQVFNNINSSPSLQGHILASEAGRIPNIFDRVPRAIPPPLFNGPQLPAQYSRAPGGHIQDLLQVNPSQDLSGLLFMRDGVAPPTPASMQLPTPQSSNHRQDGSYTAVNHINGTESLPQPPGPNEGHPSSSALNEFFDFDAWDDHDENAKPADSLVIDAMQDPATARLSV